MALEKKIIKNRPSDADYSQYNVDSSTFPGIASILYPEEDLYTTKPVGSVINENIINEHPFWWEHHGLKLSIQQIYLNAQHSWVTTNGFIEVYLFDTDVVDIPYNFRPCENANGASTCDTTADLVDGSGTQSVGVNKIWRKQFVDNSHDDDDMYGDVWFYNLDLYIKDFPYNTVSEEFDSNRGDYGYDDVDGAFDWGTQTSANVSAQITAENWNWNLHGGGGGDFIISIRMAGDRDKVDWVDELDRSYQNFTIPKSHFYELLEPWSSYSSSPLATKTLTWGPSWGSGDPYSYSDVASGVPTTYEDNYGTNDDGSDSAHIWRVDGLHVSLDRIFDSDFTSGIPTDDASFMALYGFEPGDDFDGSINNLNWNRPDNYWKFRPNGLFYTWHLNNFMGITESTDIIDFRPISIATVSEGKYDVQSYYTDDSPDVQLEVAAPNQVHLKLQIANVQTGGHINYIDGSETGEIDFSDAGAEYPEHISEGDNNLIFIAFVTNWDLTDDDPNDLDTLVEEQFPTSLGGLSTQQYFGKYLYVESELDENNIPTIESDRLSHIYQSPGIKTIQVVVFSAISAYAGNNITSDFPRQAMRWKLLNVRVNLSLDISYIEDFDDVGGADFVFLPWPETSVVISGLSDSSEYRKSLKHVVDANLFSQDDYSTQTKMFANKSYENEEYGSYIGKTDIEQVRCFIDGSYDMTKILGIEDNLENQIDSYNKNIFYPHTNDSFYDGYVNSFSEETSALSIFIDGNMDRDMVSKCIFEINAGDSSGGSIRDSAGNGNRGVLIGDYKITKTSKDSPVIRDSVMKTPEIDSKDRAL
tara:strand:+ start:5937 stop:8375 length:2439 start_codon:yes stop_codon:yes gene_type:complete